jgi:hypothetical protein
VKNRLKFDDETAEDWFKKLLFKVDLPLEAEIELSLEDRLPALPVTGLLNCLLALIFSSGFKSLFLPPSYGTR